MSFSYDSKTVFRDLSIVFGKGWTALVGPNGSGKSTLLRLISGVLVPDSGSVCAGGNIAVCPQTAEKAPSCFYDPEILNGGEFFPLLDKLEIGEDWAGHWDTLARKPDVLFLDEPANHIDFKTMEILLAALASSTVMLHPDSGGLSRVFSFALPPLETLAVFEKEREGKRQTRNRLSVEVRKIARAKKDAVREAAEKKQKSMSGKNISQRDSDAGEKINLARLTGKDKSGGRKISSL